MYNKLQVVIIPKNKEYLSKACNNFQKVKTILIQVKNRRQSLVRLCFKRDRSNKHSKIYLVFH